MAQLFVFPPAVSPSVVSILPPSRPLVPQLLVFPRFSTHQMFKPRAFPIPGPWAQSVFVIRILSDYRSDIHPSPHPLPFPPPVSFLPSSNTRTLTIQVQVSRATNS